MVRSDHSLTLTMTTVNVTLETTPVPGIGHHFTVRSHTDLTAFVPEVSILDLVAWLDDDSAEHTGTREYTDPLSCHVALHVRKRLHGMTCEELVEFSVIDRLGETGSMVILTYPQTRALVAYLTP